MWSVVSASVIGTSHQATGVPCQDACCVLRLRIGDEEVLLAAVADGAGSASHSQIGSAEAVHHALKLVSQSGVGHPADIGQELVSGWYKEVLEHLLEVAKREAVPLSELACTLLLAIVWRNGAVLAQIGDGAWVLEKDGSLVTGTWPETGEYANITVFLTTSGALRHLQFHRIEATVGAIAGFTDGIQSLTLDYAQRTPSVRFFNAMFGPLRLNGDESEFIAPLRQMLASELFCSRTDDDKTLLIAVWREPQSVQDREPAEPGKEAIAGRLNATMNALGEENLSSLKAAGKASDGVAD